MQFIDTSLMGHHLVMDMIFILEQILQVALQL